MTPLRMAVLIMLAGSILWSQDAAPSRPRRLTNIVNSYPMLSPDGTRVLFQSNRSGRWEIYTMKPDGSEVHQITNMPGDNVTPCWSPEGSKIAFARSANPSDDSEIFVMNADGSAVKRLTSAAGDDSHPHWAANGRIVFNSARTTPDLKADWSRQYHEVFSMLPDGGDLRQHTRCRTVCTYPSLSPDGSKLVYRKVTNTPGFQYDLTSAERNSEVFVSSVDGSNEVNISRSAAFDGWPHWSPDGKLVVFASNRLGPANVSQLFVVQPDGNGLKALTSGPLSYAQPNWSADRKKIYAYSNVEGNGPEYGDVVVLDVP